MSQNVGITIIANANVVQSDVTITDNNAEIANRDNARGKYVKCQSVIRNDLGLIRFLSLNRYKASFDHNLLS